ncbi:hypothetical protein PanWU01x14_279310 [Parasponia andersonii]|uniref:Uncharacterized protein n=1 Tax=Parasponia andersonii TaxID=3476 RepID=A0A2P5B1T3_PARAD|nr:hypothetical protein PanWU01x14_279310 [Parasponia andersonii]
MDGSETVVEQQEHGNRKGLCLLIWHCQVEITNWGGTYSGMPSKNIIAGLVRGGL